MTTRSIRQQFADTMLEVGQADPRLCVLVGDISHFILQPFAKACPGRYYNIGICEPSMVSVAAGLAKTGLYPVVHTIAPFLIERSFEQFKLDFVYHGLGGSVITVGGAFDYSNLGCTHHCYGDFALMKTLPGTRIYHPATASELDTLFKATYRDACLRLYRLPARSHGVKLSSAVEPGRIVRVREGSDVTLVATGPQLDSAVGAAERLAASGHSAEVLYVPTIRPLDTETLGRSVSRTGRVVVIEEHLTSGGLGDDVLRALAGKTPLAYRSVSIPDRLVTDYGTYDQHCVRLGLTPEGVERAAREILTPQRA
ncbi:MAG: putative 33.6 kDa protein in fasciation locus [Candidatus Omnitrophica bacterium]|nr:putative 33.6 kDa protein in fasciation locus [Candidatus Omnitrophota bacterium]